MAQDKKNLAQGRSSLSKLSKESTSWVKNVGKSVGWSSSEALKEMVPTLSKNTEYVTNVSKDFAEKIKSSNKSNDSIARRFKNVARETTNNLNKSIKTGVFGDKKRAANADKRLKETLGFAVSDDVHDFEDFAEEGNESTSKKLDGKDLDIDFDNLTINSKTTILKSNSSKSVSALTGSIAKIGSSIVEVNGNGFSSVIDSIQNLNSVQTTYFEGSITMINSMNETLSMIEKFTHSTSMTSSTENGNLASILQGEFSISEFADYFSSLKDNSKNGKDKDKFNKIAQFVANPLQGLMTAGMSKILKPILSKTPLAGIDKEVGDLPVTLYNFIDGDLKDSSIYKMASKRYSKLKPDSKIKNGIDKYLKSKMDDDTDDKFSGVRSFLLNNLFGGKLQTEFDNKPKAKADAKVAFDAQTHNSINVVIPGYLSKILSAISGNEEVSFSYEDGEWKTNSSIKAKSDKDRMEALGRNSRISNIFDDKDAPKFEGKKEDIINSLVKNDIRNANSLGKVKDEISLNDRIALADMFDKKSKFFGGNKLANAITSAQSTLSEFNKNYLDDKGSSKNAFNDKTTKSSTAYTANNGSYRTNILGMEILTGINSNIKDIYDLLVDSFNIRENNSSSSNNSFTSTSNNSTITDNSTNSVKTVIDSIKGQNTSIKEKASELKNTAKETIANLNNEVSDKNSLGLMGSIIGGTVKTGKTGISTVGVPAALLALKAGIGGAKLGGKVVKGTGSGVIKASKAIYGKISNLGDKKYLKELKSSNKDSRVDKLIATVNSLKKKLSDKTPDKVGSTLSGASKLLSKIPSKYLKMGMAGMAGAGILGTVLGGNKVSADQVSSAPSDISSAQSTLKTAASNMTNDVNSQVSNNPVFSSFMKDPSGVANQIFNLSPAGSVLSMKNNGMDPLNPDSIVTNKIKGFFSKLSKQLDTRISGGSSSSGSSSSSSSSSSSAGGGPVGSKNDFLKHSLKEGFGVPLDNAVKKAKGNSRFKYLLNDDETAIKNLLTEVAKNGVSPEFFVAHEIAEGYNSQWGWWNNTSPKGNPLQDAIATCQWATGTAASSGPVSLAWDDPGGGTVGMVPQDVRSKGEKDAASLPSGSIGRLYLQGTAAATWAAYYPQGLNAANNGVQNYGDPIKESMDIISSMGGSSSSSKAKAKSSSNGSSSSSSSSSSSDSSGSTATSSGQSKASSDKFMSVMNSDLGQVIGSGQCYAFTSQYAKQVDPVHIPNGLVGFMAAADIGTDYPWDKWGWTVVKDPKYSDLRPGDIINYKRGGMVNNWTADGTYGHTGVVGKVTGGNKFELYDQNPTPVKKLEVAFTPGSVATIIHPPGSVAGQSSASASGNKAGSNGSDSIEDEKDASYAKLSDEEYQAIIKRVEGKYSKALFGGKGNSKGGSSATNGGSSNNSGNNSGSNSSVINNNGNNSNNSGNNTNNNGSNAKPNNNSNNGNNNSNNNGSNAKPNSGTNYSYEGLEILKSILSKVTDIKTYTSNMLNKIISILSNLKDSVDGVNTNNELIKETNKLIATLKIQVINNNNNNNDNSDPTNPANPKSAYGFNLDRNMMDPVLRGF